MIELALPAGSLETALTAFSYGADAVYFGLREFSARKGAVNFSEEDLSKVRAYALRNGKKIYVTVNTLIDDRNLDHCIDLLAMIDFYGCDGIITQDLGIARIMREYFPSLPIHGSTQLAVHTSEGVRELVDLGFERVVLSRELTFREIEKIRRECPDVQLKAFIHGALCYGFSGLCSASFLKCGRSANGGECAQICRSWFTDTDTGKNGYFFSMEDLRIGEEILRLNEIGIDSAKIEGRLKSPEYVAAVTRYYRSILDTGKADGQSLQDVETSFERKSGTGYFHYEKNRPSLLSGPYPGHMGAECGRIVRQNPSAITIETKVRIENHDGLQYFTEDRFGLPVSHKFSASILRSTEDNVTLRLESDERLLGNMVYKISDSTRREKTPSVQIPLFRKPVEIAVTLGGDSITATSLGKSITRPLMLQEAKRPIEPKETIEHHFSQSGESRYTLGNLTFRNESGISFPFLPPSVMKEFRREFYALLNEVRPARPEIAETARLKESIVLPERELLAEDLPWSLKAKRIDGRTYFSFPPITFTEEKTFEEMLKAVKGHENVTIGLNNIAQVRFAKSHPEFDYFIDIFLYLSNRYAALSLLDEIPGLVGGYLWFERSTKEGQWPFEPTVTDYEPPVFISRTCYRHDAMGLPCTGCSMKEDFSILQAPDTFSVKVRNCITVVERNR